jgi:hypothetical protein
VQTERATAVIDDLAALNVLARHPSAANLWPKTIKNYRSLDQLSAFLFTRNADERVKNRVRTC